MKLSDALFSRSAVYGLFLLLFTLGSASARSAEDRSYQQLMWVDLLPLEDLQALLNPPPMLHLFGEEDESSQALRRDTDGKFGSSGSDAYEKALVSTNVNTELHGLDASLPGFIVPLEYDDEQRVTEFFLVPWFGACLHVPPPPPNQLVYVSYAAGLDQESIFDPYTVEGRLLTEITDNAMALSAYRMEAVAIRPYVEEDAGDTYRD